MQENWQFQSDTEKKKTNSAIGACYQKQGIIEWEKVLRV